MKMHAGGSGFAVFDAQRLADCTKQLMEAVAALPLATTDTVRPVREFYERLAPQDNPVIQRDAWIERSCNQALAEGGLANELREGCMSVWVATRDGERECDGRQLFADPQWQTHATMRSGVYRSFERPEHDLEGATLWVKLAAWTQVFPKLLARLEGASLEPRSADRHGMDKAPMPEAHLTAWLKGLGSEAEDVSQAALYEVAKAAFPRNRVTREQIRRMTAGRKRGPKPIRP